VLLIVLDNATERCIQDGSLWRFTPPQPRVGRRALHGDVPRLVLLYFVNRPAPLHDPARVVGQGTSTYDRPSIPTVDPTQTRPHFAGPTRCEYGAPGVTQRGPYLGFESGQPRTSPGPLG